MKSIKSGFTIVELMVTIGIMVVLFAISGLSISRLPSSASATSSFDILISDMRLQQSQAMAGFTNGGAADNYGIHFESTGYILFKGSTYIPSAPGNFVVNLDPGLSFTNITVPGGSVVFEMGSGDVLNYIFGNDTFSMTNNQTGETKLIKINKYGATY